MKSSDVNTKGHRKAKIDLLVKQNERKRPKVGDDLLPKFAKKERKKTSNKSPFFFGK